MTAKIIIIVALALGAFGVAEGRPAHAGCVDLIDEHGHIETICWAIPATSDSRQLEPDGPYFEVRGLEEGSELAAPGFSL